jgi:hypothetical protein
MSKRDFFKKVAGLVSPEVRFVGIGKPALCIVLMDDFRLRELCKSPSRKEALKSMNRFGRWLAEFKFARRRVSL